MENNEVKFKVEKATKAGEVDDWGFGPVGPRVLEMEDGDFYDVFPA